MRPAARRPTPAHTRLLLGFLSRRDLARRAHLHHSFVCRVLTGERRPSLPAAERWARALGITLDELYKRLGTYAKALR